MKANLLIVGSTNWDHSLQVPNLPRAGETVHQANYVASLGGKGANQAVAATRTGTAPLFLSAIGADAFGEAARSSLNSYGVPGDLITTDYNRATGQAFIFVDSEAENCIAVSSGANHCVTADLCRRHASAFEEVSVVLVQLETAPEVVNTIPELISKDCRLIVNPAPACPLSDATLARIDLFVPNESELEFYAQTDIKSPKDAVAASRVLLEKGVGMVIATLGRSGCYLVTQSDSLHVPAFSVDAKDTTGAGDIFNGSLAAILAGGGSLGEAINYAAAASALSVTQVGAATSTPDRHEVEAFLKKYRPSLTLPSALEI